MPLAELNCIILLDGKWWQTGKQCWNKSSSCPTLPTDLRRTTDALGRNSQTNHHIPALLISFNTLVFSPTPTVASRANSCNQNGSDPENVPRENPLVWAAHGHDRTSPHRAIRYRYCLIIRRRLFRIARTLASNATLIPFSAPLLSRTCARQRCSRMLNND